MLLIFMLAASFNGALAHIIKFKYFLQHDPETFALHACAAIMTTYAAILALILPMTLHPLTFSTVPISISVFASRTLADFHRRG